MADKGLDPQQLAQIFSAANQTAQNEYYNSKLSGEAEDRALNRAKFAWQQQLDRAGLTGMFEGSPTFDAMKSYADMFGDWSTPQAGQKTLAAQKQAFDIAQGEAGLTGTYNGGQTQAAAKQAADIAAMNAGLTGYLGGTQTLAGQQQGWQQGFSQQQQADKNRQDYLQLLSGLRGPADYGQYLKVLGSTPGGLRDLAGAAAGQFQVASGATSGQQPVPVSMDSFLNSAATGAGQNYGANGGGMPSQYQPGQYAYPQSQPGYAQQQGQMQAYDPNNPQLAQMRAEGERQRAAMQAQYGGANGGQMQADVYRQQYGATDPAALEAQRAAYAQANPNGAMSPEQQALMNQRAQWQGNTGYQQAENAQRTAMGQLNQQAQQFQPYTYGSPAGNNMQPAAQGTSYDSYMRAAQGLPPPNQIAPQAYNALTTTGRQMLGGMYEQQGYNLNDVTDLYKQSLPKYGSAGPQTGGFKFG